MGSLRRTPRLSEAAIVERYIGGDSVSLLALKCRVPDYYVTAILTAARVRIRGPAEALRLALKNKKARAC